MDDASDLRLVYVTYPSMDLAHKAAQSMVAAHHAACANILPAMCSVYHWKGRIEQADEVVVIFKTTREKLGALETAVTNAHTYEVPCIISWALSDGTAPYLNWLRAEISTDLSSR